MIAVPDRSVQILGSHAFGNHASPTVSIHRANTAHPVHRFSLPAHTVDYFQYVLRSIGVELKAARRRRCW